MTGGAKPECLSSGVKTIVDLRVGGCLKLVDQTSDKIFGKHRMRKKHR